MGKGTRIGTMSIIWLAESATSWRLSLPFLIVGRCNRWIANAVSRLKRFRSLGWAGYWASATIRDQKPE